MFEIDKVDRVDTKSKIMISKSLVCILQVVSSESVFLFHISLSKFLILLEILQGWIDGLRG
jgi:hypothetical protein